MKIPEKKEMLYEGKAKIIYKTSDPEFLIQYFKDDTTAFNNKKFEVIESKGIINNEISSIIMGHLTEIIPNHFVYKINEREQLIRPVKIIPLEVVVRNIASGSFCRNFGVKEGVELATPLVEFFYKKDELNDPAIAPNQIVSLEIASFEEIKILEEYAKKVNLFLKDYFAKLDIKLVDFKIEFGFDSKNNIILADEISPDSCRLWDKNTNKILDKDIFRKDLGSLVEGYTDILNRMKKIR